MDERVPKQQNRIENHGNLFGNPCKIGLTSRRIQAYDKFVNKEKTIFV